MRRAYSLLAGVLLLSVATGCGTDATASARPATLTNELREQYARRQAETGLTATPAPAASGADASTPAAAAPAGASSSGVAAVAPANVAGPLAAPPTAAAATPRPATIVTPRPTATPSPAPAPAQLAITRVALARVDQTFEIRVTLVNRSTAPVNGFNLALSWYDGGHYRSGEFGKDSPDRWTLIEPGKSYTWTLEIQSTAVTRPVTVSVLQAVAVDGTVWTPPPGTAPYVLK